MKAEKRERRRSTAVSTGTETIDVRTSDGWSLRVDVHEPGQAPVGVALLAHAAMARRSSFDRPPGRGVVPLFVGRGWRVVAFDFRGHGDSGPSGGQRESWGYDDLVACDVPAVFSYAEAQRPAGARLVGVGHSLGGHVILAAQGTGRVAFDGIVTVASNVWTRDLEPSLPRWAAKRTALRAALALCRRAGRFPARALRAGSDDESQEFFEDWERFSRCGWQSRDGRADYFRALGDVRCPVLQVVSDGDRLVCPPECGKRFVARCGGPQSVERVRASDAGGPAPGHMALVTGGEVERVWRRVEEWMRSSRQVLG
jgi:predicted alpha/beta hydrolase